MKYQFTHFRHILVAGSLMLLGMLGIASHAGADTLVLDNPTGDLGTTHTYTLHGVNIVATGFNGGDLYGKNSGTGEQGLGLVNDPSGDHEIWHKTTGAQDFIQLNLLNLINAGFTSFEFQMGSTTDGEQWQVAACSTSGVLCSNGSTLTGTNENVYSAPLNLSAADPYLDFSSNNGNVLLGSISATPPSATPEPSSLLMLSSGLIGLGCMRRKVFNS
jgi:hypothetical protein